VIGQIKTILMKKSLKKGYALFTAIIITGMLVLIAYGTANLSIKQLLLSVTTADSHLAFYVADSGVECAMYWDLKNGATSAFDATALGAVTCGNTTVTPTRVVSGGNATSTFQIPVGTSCAIVVVAKVGTNTTIESKGYNTCGGGDRLERAIRITY